jgi:hypothetical protein
MKLSSLKLKHPLPRRGIAIALALVAVASLVMGREKAAPDAPVSRSMPVEKPTAVFDIDLSRLERAQSEGQKDAPQANPFAALSFAPPPAPRRQARAKAEPPQAPPLPFRYAGKLTQGGKTEVFVVRGEEIISVAAGQNIDAEYRVDELGPERIAFTYLPLKTRQSLELEEGGGEGGG